VLPFYNSYSYLKNTELGELLNLELKSTELALFKEGKPSIKINVESIDEYTLGMLFMLFQVTVAVVGLSLKINPFDQPGVEEGKKFAYGLLGREGFEEKKEEFEKIYKKFDDYII
jgi:glucose-6-phosphate isomerase